MALLVTLSLNLWKAFMNKINITTKMIEKDVIGMIKARV
jgi:hypothetical protein